MLAARLHAPGERLRLETVDPPQPAGSEVVVRVGGCGVCRTDLHIAEGTQTRVILPRTLGHEVAGWIEDAGPDAVPVLRRGRLAIGDPVLVHGGWGCGECLDCGAGEEQRCARSLAPGFQLDGGYAELMLVPHPRHLLALRELDPARAAPLADAGVTAYRAVERAMPWLGSGARVLVIGCGAVGQFALQLLRLAPPDGGRLRIAVSDLDPVRLERAAELGADMALRAPEPEMTLEALGGAAEVVIDIVGTDATLEHAARTVAPGGAVLLVGESGGRLAVDFATPSIEAWVTTVAWGSVRQLREVLRLAERGRLRWETEPMPLRAAADALERVRAGDVVGRLVLVP